MAEVDLGVDPSLPRGIQQVRHERKWVAVFAGDLVQPAVVDTEAERAVFLLDEEDGSSARGVRRADEPRAEVLVDVLAECVEFEFGEGVDGSEGRSSPFFQVDLEVVGAVFQEDVGLGFAEDVRKLVVLRRYPREVRWRVGDG